MKQKCVQRASTILILCFQTSFAQRINPENFEYRGAFKLPAGSNGSNWEYSGYGMTFYPGGDAGGPNDGYPGSIFAIGHDHHQMVSEINIPVPVISPGKSIDELNTAQTLQAFQDITHGMFGELEIPRADLAYLPAQGTQTTDKLYFCWGQHFQFEFFPSHGACDLNLSNPQTSGPWFFGNFTNYVTNDYLFEIPAAWADPHVPGARLASGRFRDGGWGGHGPTLFAFDPWNDGQPPAENGTLASITPLLLYGIQEPGVIEISTSDAMKMNGYSEADEWSGGAWLTAGENSAVAFVGTKGLGNFWYGFSNGVVWPFEGPYPPVPEFPYDDRGWWSDSIQAQIIFFDPADFAAVARGEKQTFNPQPYAHLNLDPVLFAPGFDLWDYKRYSLGACCFDRENSLLYIFERQVVDGASLIHTWFINSNISGVQTKSKNHSTILRQNHPNPFSHLTKIEYQLPQPAQIELSLWDVRGRKVLQFFTGMQSTGLHQIMWTGKDSNGISVTSGIYFLQLRGSDFNLTKKIVLLPEYN